MNKKTRKKLTTTTTTKTKQNKTKRKLCNIVQIYGFVIDEQMGRSAPIFDYQKFSVKLIFQGFNIIFRRCAAPREAKLELYVNKFTGRRQCFINVQR